MERHEVVFVEDGDKLKYITPRDLLGLFAWYPSYKINKKYNINYQLKKIMEFIRVKKFTDPLFYEKKSKFKEDP